MTIKVGVTRCMAPMADMQIRAQHPCNFLMVFIRFDLLAFAFDR